MPTQPTSQSTAANASQLSASSQFSFVTAAEANIPEGIKVLTDRRRNQWAVFPSPSADDTDAQKALQVAFQDWWAFCFSSAQKLKLGGGRTPVWNSYHEAINMRDGTLVLHCRNCSMFITHPGLKGQGTGSMLRHLKSKKCYKAIKASDNPLAAGFLNQEVLTPAHQKKPSD